MTQLEDAIKELRIIGAEFKEAFEKFARQPKVNKTDAYKKKKIAEGVARWDKYMKQVAEVKKYMTAPDQCFDDEVALVKKNYEDYVKKLMEIGQTNATTDDADDNMKVKILVQQNRFQSIQRILTDIINKTDNNEEMTESFIEIKLKKLSELWSRIEIEHENMTFSLDEAPEYTEQFLSLEEGVEQAILTLQEERKSLSSSNKNEGLKLNRVTIPKFGGDYFKWVTFRDLFTSMVIKNKSLGKSEKMQMLKTNVTDEAETLIGDLIISEANFDSAWSRLMNRYDNNRVVVCQLIDKFISQPTGKGDALSLETLLDTTDKIVLALKNMGRPTEAWDDWIVIILTQKLGESNQKDWEQKLSGTNELPTWTQLKLFMEEQFRMLERLENSAKLRESNKVKQIKSLNTTIAKRECALCKENHGLFKCNQFKKMTTQERWVLAKSKKLCFACLGTHKDQKCDREKPCIKCDKKHSTWLHKTEGKDVANAHGSVTGSGEILLATAIVRVSDVNGKDMTFRALIDNGSQGSMVTERVVKQLQLKTNWSNNSVLGLGNSNTGPAKQINVQIKPRFDSPFNFNMDCYILKQLTKTMPDDDFCTENWKHIKKLVWADPTFHKPGPIDILLGMDSIVEIMKQGLIIGPAGQPMAQNTQLGWIMSGKIDPCYPKNESKCLVAAIKPLDDDIARFWEMEELNPKRALTVDEQKCEEFYQRTTKRDQDGRYIVKIPFNTETTSPDLGVSRNQCLARFLFLEKRFAFRPQLKIDYVKVMNEYLELGHMRDVTGESNANKLYYIPHHAVMKPDSLTTKTRVVFDASAKTSKKVSLNEKMYKAAKQQDDLIEILIRWRKHFIVYKADIEKMYRQLKLDKEDQRYHTILWRDDQNKELKEYQLTTATFGTTAAPFMATRTLRQIGMDNAEQYSLAEQVISKDFYVDDLISGADNVVTAIKQKDEVMASLQKGGMNLRKWTSNNQALLDTLPEDLTEKALQSFNEDDTTKALGLQWNPKTDEFSFKVTWDTPNKIMTKRQLFSEASRLFDPLGWLAPVIIKAKLLMQAIWVAESEWDEKVPTNVEEEWNQFRDELPSLGNLRIPRWINYTLNCEMAIHGFCDASELGYAAVVYTRIQTGNDMTIKLVASKTRVSPVKTKLTLPRLELCGAVLLGALMNSVQTSLNLEKLETFAWCDSMITLGWIKSEPARWKTFVANRIVEVQSSNIMHWNYVKSDENPADCASRGLMPSELENHPLWFKGSPWLKDHPETWPNLRVEEPELERKTIAINVMTTRQPNELLRRTSSWFRMVRVMAICKRFITKIKGTVTLNEMEETRSQLLKLCQAESFPEDIRKLTAKGRVSKRSNLLSLNPFLDTQGLLRVGGRLQNAELTFNQKHPIILPASHHMTKIIIQQMHKDTLHGGAQLVTNLLRKKYWIVNGKRMANNVISKCVSCRRYQGGSSQPMMGNLPKPRVTLNRAFSHTGVDYAGAIEVKSSKLKSARIQKGYIAVYVCLSTKAFHLELVSDETTDAFLASFNRFVARRSMPITMYSDNGSNLVGGANQLEKNLIKTRNMELSQLTVNQGVNWEFIPPKSPNFGGLWERGVQSVKAHLKRTLKTSRLTFEEYSTVLCQIEACLNSRPLCQMSTDPENLDVLTPGHFLIGAPLLAPPEPDLKDNAYNNVHRWKYVQLLQQQFWKRWHVEYLTSLQQRHKWTDN